MLNGQRDLIARSQQLHYGLRVRGRAHVDAVHLQYSVAHPDFARLGRYSIGHHLQETQDLLSTIFKAIFRRIPLTCDIKMPGSWAPNGTHEWSVPPIMLKPSEPWFLGRVTSWEGQSKETEMESDKCHRLVQLNSF